MISFLDLQKITALYADEIGEATRRVIDSGWYLLGKEVTAFETAYARYIGTRHCVGVANGLDALTLIYRAYIALGKMAPGDEVIVPANTYIASILALTENRLRPVLVEPDPQTLQIDDARIEAAITPRTRSILIVHLYGRCAYTDRIGLLCRRHGLLLVEDNAQAHGCRFDAHSPSRTGSLGNAAGHSFYPGKNLGALGDGGAVTTNDEQLAACVRALANYGSGQKYVFQYCGRNSRLDELQAAVLSVKLRHLDENNRHRQQIADYYYTHLDNAKVHLPRRVADAHHVYHIFPVLCSQRDALQQHLRQHAIETLIHYPIPPHQQACYREWNHLSLPVTEQIHREELSLPISPVLTLNEAAQVVTAVNSFSK
ncbi:MAG: DegT/DnrJ/EryC1/StrS family aminotransferase [Prevotella sp.]|jgi:dTDP-4-amino-4,6-dideoxygalactose transaminase